MSRPRDFGECRQAREGHEGGALLGPDMLGPDIRLHAQYMRSLGGRQIGGPGFEGEHRSKGDDAAAPRRIAVAPWLHMVEIEVGRRAEYRLMPLWRGLARAVD